MLASVFAINLTLSRYGTIAVYLPTSGEGVILSAHYNHDRTRDIYQNRHGDESLVTTSADVDVPRSTVEAIVEFADSELDSLVNFATALAAVKTLAAPGEIASDGEDTVQLLRETVDIFEAYFAQFDTDESDVWLLFDEDYCGQFDDATATAHQALAEQ